VSRISSSRRLACSFSSIERRAMSSESCWSSIAFFWTSSAPSSASCLRLHGRGRRPAGRGTGIQNRLAERKPQSPGSTPNAPRRCFIRASRQASAVSHPPRSRRRRACAAPASARSSGRSGSARRPAARPARPRPCRCRRAPRRAAAGSIRQIEHDELSVEREPARLEAVAAVTRGARAPRSPGSGGWAVSQARSSEARPEGAVFRRNARHRTRCQQQRQENHPHAHLPLAAAFSHFPRGGSVTPAIAARRPREPRRRTSPHRPAPRPQTVGRVSCRPSPISWLTDPARMAQQAPRAAKARRRPTKSGQTLARSGADPATLRTGSRPRGTVSHRVSPRSRRHGRGLPRRGPEARPARRLGSSCRTPSTRPSSAASTARSGSGRQVAHPNVCRTYDVIEADARHFLVMEVRGRRGPRLAAASHRPAAAGQGLGGRARAVCRPGAAHEKGILHRDLSRANVMIDGRGQPRIMDFGLAVLAAEGTRTNARGRPRTWRPSS